jgi:hypothetical protein
VTRHTIDSLFGQELFVKEKTVENKDLLPKIDSQRRLSEHRGILAANKDAYTRDFPRLAKTCLAHLKAMGYKKLMPSNKAGMALVREYVFLIAKAQGFKPFFHVNGYGEDPYCWNSPYEWNIDHIRYQWGHLFPRSEGSTAHHPKNLCLQSARCNLHVQSALQMSEVEHWLKGSRVALRIARVTRARERLFKTRRWDALMSSLESYR